jgi:dihydrodipicolinate synthase/N-acetylneuraminate lyase
VARRVTAEFGVPGLKAALDLAGLGGGDPRGPLLPLGDEDRAELRRSMVESRLFPGLGEG